MNRIYGMRVLVQALALAALGMSGCAHRIVHYTAPNAAPMEESEGRFVTAVTKAHAISDEEGAKIADMKPKLDALFKAAPPELRPQIAAMQDDLQKLTDLHATEETELLNADKAKVESATERSKYEAQANDRTADANKENASANYWSKKAIYFGSHWILGVLLCLGGLGIFIFSLLVKLGIVTGKAATAVAARIP